MSIRPTDALSAAQVNGGRKDEKVKVAKLLMAGKRSIKTRRSARKR